MDDSRPDADADIEEDKDKDDTAGAGSDGSLSWEEEERREGLQVRFIRSIHELDLLGFVRHTKRGEYV